METITKKRALKHIERVKRVKDNCKDIPASHEYTVIGSGLDKGAFRVDGKTIYLAIDGSSRFGEWISNMRVLSKEGMHRGFRKHGIKLYRDLIKKLPRALAYYDTIIADGHSRGAPLCEVVIVKLNEFSTDNGIKPLIATLVSSGAPVLYTKRKLAEVTDLKIYTHHALRTAKDFVPNVKAPRGLIFRKLWAKMQLFHFTTFVYSLPTIKGEIDHKTEAYEKAIMNHWKDVKIKGNKN